RAIILAYRMDLLGRGAARIFGERLRREDLETDALLVELVLDVIVEIGGEQLLREGIGLRHEEPMVGFDGPAERDMRQQVMCRHDVEQRHPLDARRSIEGHAKSDARTAIMPGDLEALESELSHDREIVLAHGAEG